MSVQGAENEYHFSEMGCMMRQLTIFIGYHIPLRSRIDTKSNYLWPECNGILPQNYNIVAMWQAINIFLPQLEDIARISISCPIARNEEVQAKQS